MMSKNQDVDILRMKTFSLAIHGYAFTNRKKDWNSYLSHITYNLVAMLIEIYSL